jgi:nitroreductase
MSNDDAATVLRALESRRSIGRVLPDMLPRGIVEQVIEAAAWAPNHYRTQPWRFVVVTGSQREALGDVMAASLVATQEHPESPESREIAERTRRKPLRAPVIIVVAAVPSALPRAREIEDIAAVAAAVQNMLVAAHALGLGAMWRTGAPAYDPEVKTFLGLPPESHVMAFVYLGYPNLPELPERSRSSAEHVRWLGLDSTPAPK